MVRELWRHDPAGDKTSLSIEPYLKNVDNNATGRKEVLILVLKNNFPCVLVA